MEDPQAVVRLFEMEQALEQESDSDAAETAAETLSLSDEFDSLAKGEEFLSGISSRVAEPDRTHPVNFQKMAEPVADEGGYKLPDVFAPPTRAEREHEDLLKALQANPNYQAARRLVEKSLNPQPALEFRKLRSIAQLKDWVRNMLGQGHSLESLISRAKQGGDLRAASFIEDAGREVLAGV